MATRRKSDKELERKFQAELIGELREEFPGCFILKNDPNYLQGVPDLLVLHNDRWAMLEVKAHEKAELQPNQDVYVEQLNGMSYSSFIYPENKEAVLSELQQAFSPRRKARVPKR